MEIEIDPQPKKKYKPFNDTYPQCAFSLALAFLYPNRTNALKRAFYITAIITFNGGQLFWFFTYTFKCLYILDIFNFARNMSLLVVLLLFFFKTYYVIYATQTFAPLLSKISRDLLAANDLEEDYQKIYDEYIEQCKFSQTLWLFVPVGLSSQFPLYAGLLMSVESIKTDDFKRRMVHDMDLKYVENIQSESPFFECMFAYNCLQCIVLVPNYCGFDCSFCIATTHLRMKLKLMVHKIHKAFKNAKTREAIRSLVNEATRDHQDALNFYSDIQALYGPWLFSVFLLTSLIISFNLYQIYLLQRIDPQCTMFGLFGVLHIYVPCHYTSTLTKVGEEISSDIYSVPWEKWSDPELTKSLVFMIARAQKDLIITGWIVVFNMELFKSILQTSYSFFTLITA